jgi:hypothetical protein
VLEASLAEGDDGGRPLTADSGAVATRVVVTRVEGGISLVESDAGGRLLAAG